MSDPIFAFVLLVALFVALAGAHFFRTLDGALFRTWRTPLAAGAVIGFVLVWGERPLRIIVTGVLMTAAALYVRLTGEESEPVDGMLLGACSGAAASIVLAFTRADALRDASECLLASAAAGFGITFAALHVGDRTRQLVLDVITAGAATLAACLPTVLAGAGVSDRTLLIAVAAALPLIGVAAVFAHWPDVRAELSHEAAMGVFDAADVRATAHPILRLGRGGWKDAHAHRELVRLAGIVALRKRQQRGRPDEIARLYQVEIIQLRMRLQEMSRIEHDTMARSK